MRIVSDSSDLSDVDQLSYESDHEPVQARSKAKRKPAKDYAEEIDELESDQDSQPTDFTNSKSNNFKTNLPKGKLISFDAVNIPKGDKTSIDKFVSSRRNEATGEDEILVKYKNMSYYSAEWISIKKLEEDKSMRARVRRFLDKPSWDNQWSEDEPFNPSYIKIDRIIDDGELDGVLHYLTKWCSLPYDCSTWEEHTLVEQLDSDKIEEFNQSRILDQSKIDSYARPGRTNPKGKWTKLAESPKFKDDNTLRSYQLEGLNWLMFCWYNQQNSILADEMGLGKTVQSTAFLYQLYRQENIKGPFLVIVPLSTMGNWEREINTWTTMKLVVYHGNQTSRNLLVETEFYYRDQKGHLIPGIYKFDVCLTTYEMAMSGAAHLRGIPWRAAVLDEAHRLKNKNSKVTEHLKLYSMEHRVLLTGTPLQNSLDELWALLNFLDADTFSSEREFQIKYGSMNTAADVERLQLLLKPLMLRRLKEDVEKSIPVKEETVVEVELTTTQKKWYRSILEKNFAWLKQGGKKNVPNMINTMMELRKCCIHPWLLQGAEEQILTELDAHESSEKQLNALVQSSGKMVLIDKLLKKLKLGGHKVLIFSQMTKCLDLIQDYLRMKNWLFERIDGGVRGEYRQAAIDRFSSEGSECFVFLLCTRAGGVGINLTAADTCIIFDSDWNPQNDLQAQSRCHRIGQKKSVKIYRLITRNTYEREMFDRASMKLGLDKALLQRNSAGHDPFDSKSKNSSLSKQEVEDLLKKGAYGAFMDDGAGDKFCEEDIDQILERRTMVIRHDEDSENRKGSMFSKASFQAAGSSANVDVNDPDFWDKVAEQAKLDVVDEIPGEESLILDLPRVRKQIAKFDGKDIESDDGGGSDYRRSVRPADLKLWTIAERTRLERSIMQHGFFHWEKSAEAFSRRTPAHLMVCSRALVLRCLDTCTTLDKDTVADVKRALAVFYPTPTSSDDPNENVAFPKIDEDPQILQIDENDLPWKDADEKDRYEYYSFLREASLEYLDHLDKKAKNLLIRIALMYNIRHRNKPHPELFIPKILGAPPCTWWDSDQDRDLMIGICKHGYQQYNKIWSDTDLCFYNIFKEAAAGKSDTLPISNDAPKDIEMPVDGEAKEDAKDEDFDQDNDIDSQVMDEEIDQEADDLMNVDDAKAIADGNNEASALDNGSAKPIDVTANLESPNFHVPTPTELGVRVRRILAALARHRVTLAREKEKEEQLNERNRVRHERRVEKMRTREHEFSKKHKLDFQRTLLTFGVKRIPGTDKCDWTFFKPLAELQNKSDDAMDNYFKKLIAMAKEILSTQKIESSKRQLYETGIDAVDEQNALGEKANDNQQGNDDGETITFERAKKILRRVAYFDRLREKVLKMHSLSEKLAVSVRRHGKSGLPKWWDYSLDVPFLKGVDRYGLTRGEMIYNDFSLPFHGLYQEFSQSLIERQNNNIPDGELVNGKFEDKFWMKDAIALKRFELLINLAEKPVKAKKKQSRALKLKQEMRTSEAPSDEEIGSTKSLQARLKLFEDEYDMDSKNKMSKEAYEEAVKVNSDISSGGDTDDMLEAAAKCLVYSGKKRYKKRKDYNPINMLSEQAVSAKLSEIMNPESSQFPDTDSGHKENGIANPSTKMDIDSLLVDNNTVESSKRPISPEGETFVKKFKPDL